MLKGGRDVCERLRPWFVALLALRHILNGFSFSVLSATTSQT
jgi:hypothetical protein